MKDSAHEALLLLVNLLLEKQVKAHHHHKLRESLRLREKQFDFVLTLKYIRLLVERKFLEI